jgi:hypothetical protein
MSEAKSGTSLAVNLHSASLHAGYPLNKLIAAEQTP